MSILEVSRQRRFCGRLSLPGDKSITHRCLFLAAFAEQPSEIHHPASGEDCLRTAEILGELGIPIEVYPDRMIVRGLGAKPKLTTPQRALDCGNSGTTARLLMGFLAGSNVKCVIAGDRSLSSRPMSRVIEPLRQMGSMIIDNSVTGRLPVEVNGTNLRGTQLTLPVPSAQVKSAVLLASLWSNEETRLRQTPSTRDHTERLLRLMASGLREEDGWLVQGSRGALQPLRVSIPGDPSSAAFFAVGAAIHPGSEILLEGICLNPYRIKFLEVLADMGADVTCRSVLPGSWEPRGDVCIRGSKLRGVSIQPEMVPGLIDEIPALAVAMAVAEGESHISGAAELRLKESDRISVLVRELKRFGVAIREHPDGMTITGGARLRAPVHSTPSGDHRIAMALAILGTVADGTTRIRRAECIRVSFPEFEALLRQICSE